MKGTIASADPHTTHFNCWRATVFLLMMKRRIRSTALITNAATEMDERDSIEARDEFRELNPTTVLNVDERRA